MSHSGNRMRLIPDYAGSTTAVLPVERVHEAHPRLRGEHGGLVEMAPGVWGSSPTTRGAQLPWSKDHVSRRLIPDYAGSTSCSVYIWVINSAHPRLRGEHYCDVVCWIKSSGSSPTTRGAHLDGVHVASDTRLIPDYAGSTGVPPLCVVVGGLIPDYAGST